jgi:hypothetical protein
MKTRTILIGIVILSIILTSCSLVGVSNTKIIALSDVIISESRPISGFSKIEFSTLGKVNIIQGDTQSLNVSGPDNLVPEIETTVQNGILIIRSKENISVTNLNSGNMLTFTIVVKDLTNLTTSGLGDMQVDMLSTPSFSLEMSGAGHVQVNQLTAQTLDLKLSGLGAVELTGEIEQATINISGAGGVNAPDMMIHNANVTLSGVGGATLWVTDQLTGNISGVGGVNYFGNPQTNVSSSSLGSFTSLGDK